mmetsp:Transcript_39300/g.83764  ORF Transcript_39300/g.83764 Transcript_39300/m.83764 type:complete len:251 (-) Transcript_39300:182-934(-)
MKRELINTTLTPGKVLYIPRGFYHNTATAGAVRGMGDVQDDVSVALTISITTEDVYCTWLYLLGEALEEMPHPYDSAATLLRDSARVRASRMPSDELGVLLREALPRALMAPDVECPCFAGPGGDVDFGRWREHALEMLKGLVPQDASPSLGQMDWLRLEDSAMALYFKQLDGVLVRKRVPMVQKLSQIESFLGAMGAYDKTDGSTPEGVDIDTIFRIEKKDRSYLPKDRSWYTSVGMWQSNFHSALQRG